MGERLSYVLMTPDTRHMVVDYIEGLPMRPLMKVTIEPVKSGPTYSQRGLLHKWIGIIADHTGYSPSETKEILKEMFLVKVDREFAGETRMVFPSTENLSKSDYSMLMDRIQAFASTELGMVLPAINDRRG